MFYKFWLHIFVAIKNLILIIVFFKVSKTLLSQINLSFSETMTFEFTDNIWRKQLGNWSGVFSNRSAMWCSCGPV